eukprot:g20487.t1
MSSDGAVSTSSVFENEEKKKLQNKQPRCKEMYRIVCLMSVRSQCEHMVFLSSFNLFLRDLASDLRGVETLCGTGPGLCLGRALQLAGPGEARLPGPPLAV